jgi:hypothetical protein
VLLGQVGQVAEVADEQGRPEELAEPLGRLGQQHLGDVGGHGRPELGQGLVGDVDVVDEVLDGQAGRDAVAVDEDGVLAVG